jgi:hypothetical protein
MAGRLRGYTGTSGGDGRLRDPRGCGDARVGGGDTGLGRASRPRGARLGERVDAALLVVKAAQVRVAAPVASAA